MHARTGLLAAGSAAAGGLHDFSGGDGSGTGVRLLSGAATGDYRCYGTVTLKAEPEPNELGSRVAVPDEVPVEVPSNA